MFTLILFILLHLAVNLVLIYNRKLRTDRKALLVGLFLNIVISVTFPFLIGYRIWDSSLQLFYTGSSSSVLDEPLTGRIAFILLLTVWLPYIYFKYLCISFIRDLSFHYRNKLKAMEAQVRNQAAQKSKEDRPPKRRRRRNRPKHPNRSAESTH